MEHKTIRYLISTLLFLLVSPAYTSWFTDKLSYNASKAALWEARTHSVLDIEDSLYRNINLKLDCYACKVGHWDDLFFQREQLNIINQVLHQADAGNPLSIEEKALQENIKTLSNALGNLPTVELEAYRVDYMAQQLWQKLNIGDIYYESGIMTASASLHDAYDNLERTQPEMQKTIYQIRSKTGKLTEFLYEDLRTHLTWTPHTYFSVIKKEYNGTKNLHFIQLEEIDRQSIPATARIIRTHDQREMQCLRP